MNTKRSSGLSFISALSGMILLPGMAAGIAICFGVMIDGASQSPVWVQYLWTALIGIAAFIAVRKKMCSGLAWGVVMGMVGCFDIGFAMQLEELFGKNFALHAFHDVLTIGLPIIGGVIACISPYIREANDAMG